MNTTALILSLLSGVLHAFRELLTKKGTNKHDFIWLYRIVGIIIFSPGFAFYAIKHDLNVQGVLLAVLSGFIHAIYYNGLAETLDTGDISVSYPIMRSTPLLLLLGSYFILREPVTGFGVLGIMLVVFGTLTIQVRTHDLVASVQDIFRMKNYSVRMAWMVAMITVVYSIVDSLGVHYIDAFLYIYIAYFSSVFFNILVNNVLIGKHRIGRSAILEWHSHRAAIISAGIINFLSYLFVLWAFTMESVTYVVTIRQISVVVAVLLGIYFLNEGNRLIRFASSLVIYAGIGLIYIYG